jgi:ABC-type metal ion transport system substrate-binding protein
MLRKAVVGVCLIAITALCLSGCKKSTPPEQVEVLQAPQSEEEVTEQNVDEQSEKMKMEMELKEEEASQGQ